MNIIICGAGRNGYAIASYLSISQENNNITVIDSDDLALSRVQDNLDVNVYKGHASHPDILKEAGAENSDIVIAVTDSDEINMIIAYVCNTLFCVPIKIIQIVSKTYLDSLYGNLFDQQHLAIDMVISSDSVLALNIFEVLRFPGILNLFSCGKNGLFRIFSVHIIDKMPIIHMPIYRIKEIFPEFSCNVAYIERQGNIILPSNEQFIRPHDTVYFIVEALHSQEVINFFSRFYSSGIVNYNNRVLLLGGNNISKALARHFSLDDVKVTIVEKREDICKNLVHELPDVTVIHGNFADMDILREANIEITPNVICLTDSEKSNILTSLLIKRFFKNKKIYILLYSQQYQDMIYSLGIDNIIYFQDVVVSQILRFIRRGRVVSSYSVANGMGEFLEYEVLETSDILGKAVKILEIQNSSKVIAIIRQGDQILYPIEDTIVHKKDFVILFARTHVIKKIEKFFTVKVEYN